MGEQEEEKIIKLVLAQNRHWRMAAVKTLQNTLWRTILHSLRRVGATSAQICSCYSSASFAEEASQFVPAKDLAHSAARLKELPGQYLSEVCFQHLAEKFVCCDGKNKTLLQRERKSSITESLASAVLCERAGKRTTSQEILRISGDLIRKAL